MLKFSVQLLRKILNPLGADLVRIHQNPKHTLLGLKGFPVRSIIDVGANEGQFAKMISRFFPDAHLYCFEPLPEPFTKLKAWAGGQNGRVEVFNVAVGDHEATVEMNRHVQFSPSSSLLRTTKINEAIYPFMQKQSSISVPLTTLDKLMANLSEPVLPDLLIKLDVQGYEDRVIRGGTETIRKARACIVEAGIDSLYETQATFEEMVGLFSELGFQYSGNLEQTYADDGHVIYLDAVFVNRQQR
jgi:FkbM family methyltransferase